MGRTETTKQTNYTLPLLDVFNALNITASLPGKTVANVIGVSVDNEEDFFMRWTFQTVSRGGTIGGIATTVEEIEGFKVDLETAFTLIGFLAARPPIQPRDLTSIDFNLIPQTLKFNFETVIS